jgi:hypothetical protein
MYHIPDSLAFNGWIQMIIEKVLARIYGKKRGWCFTPKDFLDLGGASAVWQALRRLEQKGTIRKVLRGVYDYPMANTFLEGFAAPDPGRVALAIARSNQWTIVPDGNTALNLLGLSTQVAAHWTYLTDGRSRLYNLGGTELRFLHRSIKETAGLSYGSAVIVQAIKALGKDHIDEKVIRKLYTKKASQEWKVALKESRYVTSWVYEIIKTIAGEESDHV